VPAGAGQVEDFLGCRLACLEPCRAGHGTASTVESHEQHGIVTETLCDLHRLTAESCPALDGARPVELDGESREHPHAKRAVLLSQTFESLLEKGEQDVVPPHDEREGAGVSKSGASEQLGVAEPAGELGGVKERHTSRRGVAEPPLRGAEREQELTAPP